MRRRLVSFAGLALATGIACGTNDPPAPAGVVTSTGGDSGSGASGGRGSGGKGGKSGTGGAGGSTGGSAGNDVAGASGADDGGGGTGGSGQGGSATGGTGQGGLSQGGAGGVSGAATGGGAGVAIAGRGEEPDPCPPPADDPPAAPGVCVPGASVGAGQPVAVMAAAGDPLIAITPDELTLLLMHVTSVGEAMIADRADPGDDFGEPVLVGIEGVVGVSPDGLRVMVQASDGSLMEAARSGPGESFGTPSEGDFSLINADAAADGLRLSAPVIAADDRTLYYLAVPAEGADYPVRLSTRSGSGAWPVGTEVRSCQLKSFQGFNPVPSAVSSDGLTLYFWDSFYGTARAGFREATSGPFVWFDDLGSLVAAQPNAACDRLYYSADGILYATNG